MDTRKQTMEMQRNNVPRGPLAGYRVLEIGGVLGSYCGKLLGDLGADVIKTELPEGAEDRRLPPFAGDLPGPERSLWHRAWNTSKRSVTLDPATTEGRELFRALAGSSDAVIDACPPGHLVSLGLGYEALASENRGLVVTSVTPFGQDGPYADFQWNDFLGMAMSGLMAGCGYKDLPPSGGSVPYLAVQGAAMRAAEGTLAALWARETLGEGQHVDVSMQEAMVFGLEAQLYTPVFRETIPVWMTRDLPTRGVTFPYQCTDGFVLMVWAYHVQGMIALLEGEGGAGALSEPRWLEPGYLSENQKEADGIVTEFTRTRTRDEVLELAQRHGIPSGALNDARDLVEDPQLHARDFFQRVVDEELGREIATPRPPYLLSETPAVAGRPPRLGEHNVEVYVGELGVTPATLSALRYSGAI